MLQWSLLNCYYGNVYISVLASKNRLLFIFKIAFYDCDFLFYNKSSLPYRMYFKSPSGKRYL